MKTPRRRHRKSSRSFWKPSRAGRADLSHVRGRGLRLEPLEDRRLLSNSPPVAVDDSYVIGQDETLSVTGLPEKMLTVSLRAKDLEYDSASGMFYAAVGTDGGARANSLTEIDPVSATLGNSILIPGEPKKLLVTDDGQYAYATVSSGQEIQRFDLPSETADMKFAMPSGRSVESMDVIPGWSDAIVVSRKHDGYSPRHGGVAVYQNGVPLPNETPGFLGAGGPNILTVDETGTKAYGYQNELSSFTFYELEIDASGVQITDTHHGVLSGYGIPKIEYEDGRIYAYTGQVVDLDTLTTVGNFPGHRHYLADSETGRLYTLTTSGSTAIIETFNLANMVKMDTLEIPGMSGSAGDVIRFGERGLAFRDLEHVYFLQTNIVPHGGQYGVLENDGDADGDLLTAFVVDGPDHGDLKLNTDGSFTYTPDSGFLGVDAFTYETTDGQAVSNVATVTITVNGPPVANADGPYVVDEGQTLVVGVSTTLIAESGFNDQAGIHSDPTPDSPYQFGETIHGRSDLEPGWADTWVVSAGGGAGGYHRAKAMADDPWEGDGAVYIQETDPYDPTWVYRVWDSPSSELLLIEQHVRLPAGGSLRSRPGQGGTGSLIAADWKANSDGTFSVRDGDGQGGGDFEPTGLTWQPMQWFKVSTLIDPATDTYEFYVNGRKYEAPDPLGFRGTPSLIDRVEYLTPSEAWVDEVRVYSVDASGEVGVLENDSDPDGDPLTAVLVDGPSHGSLTLLSNGSFTYTPEDGFAGVDTFTYKASDGLLDSNVAAVTIEVSEAWSEYRNLVMLDEPFAYYRLGEAAGATTAVDETGIHHGTYVNDPILEVTGAILTDPNTAARFDATQYVEGTTMADYGSRMIDGFTIECWVRLSVPTDWSNILGTANPGYTTNVQLSVDQTRSMRLYFRDDDWDRYSVWFYSEGHNAEIFDQEWHHLVFAYEPTPANPSDRFELYIDSVPQELEVQPGNDRPDGTSDFVYPMILGGWHQRGTVIPTYEGDLDEVAFYTRPLSWTEAGEHYAAAVGNHVPMATDDAYYVDENTHLAVTVESGLLANDGDADGDPLVATLVSLPSHGALMVNGDGSFIYTPDADFRGVDTFTYKATDGEADSNVATVLIGVSPDVVVNSTADPGDGTPDAAETTLREAIDAANAIPGTQTILFDIPTTDPGYSAGTGTFTIRPRFALPGITDPVVLDAWTQPGFAGAPVIELDGSLAGTDGLVITADHSTVRGLVVNRFSGNGIVLRGGSHNVIEGNYIGTDVSGTVALGNGTHGVWIRNAAQSNRIGTNGDGVADEAERNVISANTYDGVVIIGTGVDFNVVAGNYIGTDASGTAALGNGRFGVNVANGARSNRLGTEGDGAADEAERNVISANASHGVVIQGAGTDSNVLAGNYIGTDVSGTVALGNGFGVGWGYGVVIHSGAQSNRIGTNGDGVADASERNVISASASRGVTIWGTGTDGNVVAGNYIGTDASGTSPLGNGDHGVYITDWQGAPQANLIGTNGDGVADEAERNVISANALDGVHIRGAGTNFNVVAGNYIGTDVSGTVALGNGYDGIAIEDGAQANRVGTDGDGVADAAERNLISGNANLGVRIYGAGTDGNVVAGNYIGTDASGTLPLGNGFGVAWGHAVVIGRGARFNRIGTNGDDVADAAERNVISANAKTGVVIQDAGTDHNVVAGNYIGTDAAGLNALGNGQHGVLIQNRGEGGPQHNLVGTNGDGVADEAERNVISGNGSDGVLIWGVGVKKNVVAGNYLGTDVSGTIALGNGSVDPQGRGVRIGEGAKYNRIGTNGDGLFDEAERNVISGNASHGVLITGYETMLNVVAGNYIGTDLTGSIALGNGFGGEGGSGVSIADGAEANRIGTDGDALADAAERNVIAANYAHGVLITGHGTATNVVAGNYIGTDVTGTVALGNGLGGEGGAGIAISQEARSNRIGTDGDGVADASERNVVSANCGSGVHIAGSGADNNVVAGNYIGTDVTGTTALGNAGHGVFILDEGRDGGPVFNRIGTKGDGVADDAERNVISGNLLHGVLITGPGTELNVVAGNYIGIDATGSAPLGNGYGAEPGAGIALAGGTQRNRIGTNGDGFADAAERNVIASNCSHGVLITHWQTQRNVVAGNYIGTDVAGAEALGNGGHGVYITSGAWSNAIGGDAASGNLIAWNAGAGVAVVGEEATGNRIQANSIHDNGGLGIDLGDDGVTPNDPGDADAGPNSLQNYPVIASGLVGASTRVIGTLHSAPNAEYTLDFYANTAADPSGFGEGERWLGATVVTTDASGKAAFSVLLPSETTSGELITATATDADGNTSEFSAAQDDRTVDLGTVAFEELLELDLSEGAIWCRLQTCRAGYLTVEAVYGRAGGTAELTLHDEHGEPLATSSSGTGYERMDRQASHAGEVYWIELTGTNPRVDLRVCNQVDREGTRVSVYGSDRDDRFEFDAYVPHAQTIHQQVHHWVMINGVAYTFSFFPIHSLTLFVAFDGGGGDDTAVFRRSLADVELWPDRGRVDGSGYTVTTKNVEATTAYSNGRAAVAVLHDSPAADTFTAGPDSAELTGPGFALSVHGFPEVHAFASDDGQTDTAIFEDLAGSKDRFRAWSTEAKMFGLGFYNRAKGFDDVQAGASDATDVAEIHDSPGADAFEAYADGATMGYEDGTVVRADDFRWLFAFASDDGQTDTAHLYDTTANPGTSYATWFKGFHGTAKMYAVSTFYNRVDGFDEVIASVVGSDDTAKLFDSPGADALEAYADQATMSYPDGTTVRADDFRWVLACASDDGQVDTAQFYDATADLGTSYATWFKADDKIARLYADPVFYVQARDFDRASASAVGGDDTAKLYDSALDDVYWSRPDHGRMEYADGTFAEALDFRYVCSYSRYGSDTATLYDETGGGTSYAARFTGYATWSKLFDSTFYSRTEGFAEVRAVFWGGDDLAWVYDDPTRTDHLVVSHPNPFIAAAQAKLWNDRRAIYVDYFHTLTATTSQNFVDDADIDPAYEDDVILKGNWADA